MKNGMRILSVLLVLALCLTGLPLSAAADAAFDITTQSVLPPARTGSEYGPVQLSVGGDSASYTWSTSATGVIAGLSLSAEGVISGTCTSTGAGTGGSGGGVDHSVTVIATPKNASSSLNTVTKELSLTHYSQDPYRIYLNPNGAVDASGHRYESTTLNRDGGSTLDLADYKDLFPSYPCYVQTGWQTSQGGAAGTTFYRMEDQYPVTGQEILWARWTPITYTISYDLADGTGAQGESYASFTHTTEGNHPITLPKAPTRENYEFMGWSEDPHHENRRSARASYYLRDLSATDPVVTWEGDTPTATANITFVAQWASTDTTADLAFADGAPVFHWTDSRADSSVIAAESPFSASVTFNRVLLDTETVTLSLWYEEENGNDCSYSYPMTHDGNRAVLKNVTLPKNARKVKNVGFKVGDLTKTVSIDRAAAVPLKVTVPDGLKSPVLQAGGVSYPVSGTTASIPDLPAGTYDVKLTAWVDGYGTALLDTQSVTLLKSDHNKTVVFTAAPKAACAAAAKAVNAQNQPVKASFSWYADSEGNTLLAQGSSYTFLAGDTVYLRATPLDRDSVHCLPSGLTAVTAAGELTVTLADKASFTADLTPTLAALDGSAGTMAGKVRVSVSRPGLSGYADVTSLTQNTGTAFSLNDLTEGSVITVSAVDTGCHEALTHTVTAEEVQTHGLSEPSWRLPLADGLAAVTLTLDGKPSYFRLSSMTACTLTKADGTQLATRIEGNNLILLHPAQVATGEELTLSVRLNTTYPEEEFPYLVGTKTFSFRETNGKKQAAVSLDLTQRGYFFVVWKRSVLNAFACLVYDASGALVWTRRTAVGTRIDSGGTFSSPFLPAGGYTVVMVNRDVFDAHEPQDYATLAQARALPLSVAQAATLTAETWTRVNVTLPDGDSGAGRVNRDLSGVAMARTYEGYVTLDLLCTPTSEFRPDEGENVSLYIVTDQLFNDYYQGQRDHTRALSINGKAVPLNHWAGSENGMIGSNGTRNGVIQLTLTPEELEEYGGFPLRFSTTFVQRNMESLSARAYLRYTQASTDRHDFIGEFSADTGALTLIAPEAVTTGSFTVYGRGPASGKDNPYTVEITVNGSPVATARTDTQKGWYKAKLDLQGIPEGTVLRLSAVGRFKDGAQPLSSAPAFCDYTPQTGALRRLEMLYETYKGAASLNTILLLDNGDPVNLGRFYYRGLGFGNEGGNQWRMTFDNADQITGAEVLVRRGNDQTVIVTAEKQDNGTWLTPLTYFPGLAPDDVTVRYAVKTPEDRLASAVAPDAEALKHVYDRLNSTDLISNLTVAGKALRFTLSSGGSRSLAVSLREEELTWDADEVAQLGEIQKAFSYPAENDGDLFPNVLLYQEGLFPAAEVDGFGTDDVALLGTQSIERYLDADGHVYYLSATATLTRRVVVLWDVTNQKKTMTVMDLGTPGLTNPQLDAALAARATAAGETPEAVQAILTAERVAVMAQTWEAVYQQLARAFTQAAAAELAGEAISSPAGTLAGLQSLPAQGRLAAGRKFNWENLRETTQRLNEAYKAGQEYSEWMSEVDVTADEAHQLHLFLKDNYCLELLFKENRSNGNLGPFDVVPEIKELYWSTMVEKVHDALDTAMDFGKSFGEKGLVAVWDFVKDKVEQMPEQRLKDAARTTVFGRKATRVAQRLYYAARYAETYERGGLCSEGINWTHFPAKLYKPEDDSYTKNILDHYRQQILTPLPVMTKKAPEEPCAKYDPAGYVYEAVPSNRVEGALVTLYHLEGGAAVQTDADLYGLEPNPQTTGADGRYQWFVPQGWWRVKAEKEGYTAADTGASSAYGLEAEKKADGNCYMPVLPVQLDVNLPLVSQEAPEIVDIIATPEGVFLTFSRYLQDDALLPENFLLEVNGEEATPLTVTGVNSEKRSEAPGETVSYSSIVQLTVDGLAEGKSVTVTAQPGLLSYAGVPAGGATANTTVAAPTPADTPTASLPAGEVAPNTVVTLSAGAGAVIHYTLDGTDPTKASPVYTQGIPIDRSLTLKAVALQPGRTASEVLTADYTVPQSSTLVPAKVTATMDGRTVRDGDTVRPGALRLETATPGAQIYYTTNGVCPMYADTPILYTEPIELTEGTVFLRIRAKLNGVWSEGLPLHLTVSESAPIPQETPTVTVKKPFGGSAALTPEAPAPGETVTVRLTPEADFIAAGVTVTDSAGQEVPVTRVSYGVYTFVMPEDAVTVSASFRRRIFTDVPDDAWYQRAVYACYDRGFFVGVSETEFAPLALMDRGMFATVLHNVAGKPQAAGEPPFSDVPNRKYYALPVTWAADKGYLAGYGDGRFGPKDPITREQIVSVLWRYAGRPVPDIPEGEDVLAAFTDAGRISPYARTAMAWAVSVGLVAGKGDGRLDPRGEATRAEVAQLLVTYPLLIAE